MKNIFSNKKWMCIIALLLLVISLSSCSSEINDFEDIYDNGLSLVLFISGGASILMILFNYFGVSSEHDIIDIDGKKHWITRYKSVDGSDLRTAINAGRGLFLYTFPLVLGIFIYGLIILMTGEINIFLDLFLNIVCIYASYKVCFRIPIIISISYYILLIFVVSAFVFLILYCIYIVGENRS